MNGAAAKLGFYSSIIGFVAAASYGVVQSLQVLGMLAYPLAEILIYATSLCIAVPFLLAMLALHEATEAQRRLWSRGALLFAAIYVTYVALMYSVQLSVVIPKSMQSPATDVLGVAPQTLFWVIDALGYIAMGIATLFAACALRGRSAGLWARRFLLANAIITPIIAFIYFYPHFSLVVLLLGSPWLITARDRSCRWRSISAKLTPFCSGNAAAKWRWPELSYIKTPWPRRR